MPLVLDDAILVPPSLRRGPPARAYNYVQPGTSTTVIEASDRHIHHRPLTPPRSPVFIHQESTTYFPPKGRDSLEEFRGEVEYVTPGSRRLYYAGSEPGRVRHRSFSVGEYDSGVELSRPTGFIDQDYSLEDGSRHSYAEYDHHHGPHVVPVFHRHEDYPGPNESERHHRHVRHLEQAGLAAGALGTAKEIHDHRARHREYHSDSADEGHHNHRGRKAAAAALGATAAGIAAHQIYQHRHRSRSRSRSSDSHTSDSDHPGRKIAGAALGGTAAGIAAHKIHQHRRKSKTGSISSRSSSSGREGHHHRGAGTAAALGTGLAARHVHHRRHSRSRSSSRSRSKEREPWTRHISAAALGATAAGLAHHEHKHHHHERPRPVLRRSYSEGGFREHDHTFHRRRSPSPRNHNKLKKTAATAAAVVVAKKAIDHFRHDRDRSVSTSPKSHHLFHRRSHSRSRSRPRVGVPEALAAGVIGTGLAAHREYQEKKREHELHGGGVAVPISDHHHSHVRYGSSSSYAGPGDIYP